jgi:hypothetical protein
MGVPNPAKYKRSLGLNYNNTHAMDNDGLWMGKSVKRVLVEKFNLGHMEQGRQRIISYKVHDRIRPPEREWFFKENTHEATFTQEEYDTLLSVLKRDTRVTKDSGELHLYAGFLRCPDCKKAMRRKARGEHVYYVCRTHEEKSKLECTRHTIKESVLSELVLHSIQAQITQIEALAELVDEIMGSPFINTQSVRIEQMLKDRYKELSKVNKISDGLYFDWKSGDIEYDDYIRMKTRLAEQKTALETAIGNLEEEQCRQSKGVTTESAALADFLKYKNITTLDRAVLTSLIKTIYIHEGKGITIEFNYVDEMKRVTEVNLI